MRKQLIISNRLPVRFEKTAEGMRSFSSEGGLATGLSSINNDEVKKLWVGWPGVYADDEAQQESLSQLLDHAYQPVFLDQKEVNMYYKGFSNETIWPLFHYFMECTQYNNEYWEYYKQVNEKFCDKILEVVEEGDTIWIHDYHLMLLPGMLRAKLDNKNPIGFFLHIPFPSYELFRTLPWRKEILEGLLGADLIGFHTFEYMRHFINTVYRVQGYENRLNTINANGHPVYVDTFPMGISFDKFHQTAKGEGVRQQVAAFKKRFGEVKLVLSVDRLDYTKGIKNRLHAFDMLLTQHPELRGKVSLIMLTVPSRDDVHEYKNLKVEVDELVGKINGKYSNLNWTPVHYFYRSVDFEQLVALYNLADIGLVTPLRDGMNLVAKEFVASKTNGLGVLILSEMAGAAIELEGALRINPNDQQATAQALYDAIQMSEDEQKERLQKMQKQVQTHSVEKWSKDFTTELQAVYAKAQQKERNMINGKETLELSTAFADADERLIILDYDGTLMPFFDNPYDSKPCDELKQLLSDLSRQAKVVLLSGRDHLTMEEWFGSLDIELIAEHGVWSKENGEWKKIRGLGTGWKAGIYPLLQHYVERTPGAFIEEKPYSLVFHYRRTDSWLAEIRIPQLLNMLAPVCADHHLHVLDGNKVIEVRIPGVDKGVAAQKWISRKAWDFMMVIGDDKTDEDMFAVMPEYAYTIKVGVHESKARWRIRNHEKVRALLQTLVKTNTGKDNSIRVVYQKAI